MAMMGKQNKARVSVFIESDMVLELNAFIIVLFSYYADI
jgi:hypothetical protein